MLLSHFADRFLKDFEHEWPPLALYHVHIDWCAFCIFQSLMTTLQGLEDRALWYATRDPPTSGHSSIFGRGVSEKGPVCGVRSSGLPLWNLLAVCPWASYFTSLSLHLLVYKIGTPVPQGSLLLGTLWVLSKLWIPPPVLPTIQTFSLWAESFSNHPAHISTPPPQRSSSAVVLKGWSPDQQLQQHRGTY